MKWYIKSFYEGPDQNSDEFVESDHRKIEVNRPYTPVDLIFLPSSGSQHTLLPGTRQMLGLFDVVASMDSGDPGSNEAFLQKLFVDIDSSNGEQIISDVRLSRTTHDVQDDVQAIQIDEDTYEFIIGDTDWNMISEGETKTFQIDATILPGLPLNTSLKARFNPETSPNVTWIRDGSYNMEKTVNMLINYLTY
jgi:hypothetical protein